jgi:hypothetical protein
MLRVCQILRAVRGCVSGNLESRGGYAGWASSFHSAGRWSGDPSRGNQGSGGWNPCPVDRYCDPAAAIRDPADAGSIQPNGSRAGAGGTAEQPSGIRLRLNGIAPLVARIAGRAPAMAAEGRGTFTLTTGTAALALGITALAIGIAVLKLMIARLPSGIAALAIDGPSLAEGTGTLSAGFTRLAGAVGVSILAVGLMLGGISLRRPRSGRVSRVFC